MTILHIDTSTRRAWRRAVGLAAVIAVGAALYAGWVGADEHPAVRPEPSRTVAAGCCTDARQGPTSIEPGSVVPLRSPESDGPNGAATAAQLYRQALQYLDCAALSEPENSGARVAPDQMYEFDPSGALAARIEREDQVRREPCRLLGPHEYRQAEGLMREAARRGDPRAGYFVLESDVRAAVSRAVSARAQGQPVDDRELAAALDQTQAMARRGQRDAMVLAGQLMAAGQAGPPDAVGAAAWNLVALELDVDRPLSREDLENSGVLSSLTDEEAQQALETALSLRRACCERTPSAHAP